MPASEDVEGSEGFDLNLHHTDRELLRYAERPDECNSDELGRISGTHEGCRSYVCEEDAQENARCSSPREGGQKNSGAPAPNDPLDSKMTKSSQEGGEKKGDSEGDSLASSQGNKYHHKRKRRACGGHPASPRVSGRSSTGRNSFSSFSISSFSHGSRTCSADSNDDSDLGRGPRDDSEKDSNDSDSPSLHMRGAGARDIGDVSTPPRKRMTLSWLQYADLGGWAEVEDSMESLLREQAGGGKWLVGTANVNDTSVCYMYHCPFKWKHRCPWTFRVRVTAPEGTRVFSCKPAMRAAFHSHHECTMEIAANRAHVDHRAIQVRGPHQLFCCMAQNDQNMLRYSRRDIGSWFRQQCIQVPEGGEKTAVDRCKKWAERESQSYVKRVVGGGGARIESNDEKAAERNAMGSLGHSKNGDIKDETKGDMLHVPLKERVWHGNVGEQTPAGMGRAATNAGEGCNEAHAETRQSDVAGCGWTASDLGVGWQPEATNTFLPFRPLPVRAKRVAGGACSESVRATVVLSWHASFSSSRTFSRTCSTLNKTLPTFSLSLPTYRGSAVVKRSPTAHVSRWGSSSISSSEPCGVFCGHLHTGYNTGGAHSLQARTSSHLCALQLLWLSGTPTTSS